MEEIHPKCICEAQRRRSPSQHRGATGLAFNASPISFDLAQVPKPVRAGLHSRLSRLCRLCGEFLRKSKRIHGMFERPLAEFVSRQVVSLVVRIGGSLMSVDCKVVQLGCTSVCALWHGGLLHGVTREPS
jgi:hypothetical protein